MSLPVHGLPDPGNLRQIVQLLPPGEGGVRDYMECLRDRWQQRGLASHVINLSGPLAAERSLVQRLRDLRAAEDRPLTLLLHFSGYGFHPRALCFWLVREIDRARRELGDGLRLVTMFHELYASGPPWKSAFWLSGLQARIAERIARASEHVLTNSQRHAAWLHPRVNRSVDVTVWPVFSTIGEPDGVEPADRRLPRMVVFGAASTRRRALDRWSMHADALSHTGVEEVIEVGSGVSCASASRLPNHRFVGRLDAAALRELLAQSAFGLIDYPPELLGKSTVFAAYAAHGCVAVNTLAGPDSDRLRCGQHYLDIVSFASGPSAEQVRQHMADAARSWYAGHSLGRQADAFAAACKGAAPAPAG